MYSSSTFRQLVRTLSNAGRTLVHIQGTERESVPWVSALLGRETGRRILLVEEDDQHASDRFEELCQLVHQEGDFGEVCFLPSPGISPYIELTMDNQRQLQALGTLARLARGEPRILVTSAAAMSLRQVDPQQMRSNLWTLETGAEVDREDLMTWLGNAGYARMEASTEAGTFAVRGSLLDVFSPHEDVPFRIDFFGDEVDSIAEFHPDTQLSRQRLKSVFLAPATQVLDRSSVLQRARPALLDLAGALRVPSARFAAFMDQLRDQDLPIGVEAILPLLVDATDCVLGYLEPREWLVVFSDAAGVQGEWEKQMVDHQARYERACSEGRLALEPRHLLQVPKDLSGRLATFARVDFGALSPECQFNVTLSASRAFPTPESRANRWGYFLHQTRQALDVGRSSVVVAADREEAQRFAAKAAESGVPSRIEKAHFHLKALEAETERDAPFSTRRKPPLEIYVGTVETGVDSADLGLWVVSLAEIEERRVRRTRSRSDNAALRDFLLELKPGDHVVHMDYGIGQFVGVERKVLGSGEYTCLKIQYSQGDAVYVPVHNAGGIQRYVGSGKGAPKLDKLGGATWQNRVDKARKATRKLAFDLLELYARRKAASGHSFSPTDEYFEAFERTFPYEETPDQKRAIEDVLHDMEAPSPMDRLVCGDVGFGKTEVAVRAAFKAVLDGRQVAVLVPTTVLAEQHRRTFANRLEGYPVVVESLSRFKSTREQSAVLRGLKEGRVDIVVGTHRLLGKDIHFKDLGIIIVDEEHRFGVGHKEQLKALRASVDVLSLTATPIPRTLHMAMSGIRDLSVMKSPPPGRRDIHTSLIPFDAALIGKAIKKEMERKGQVFFLHNRVEDLGTLKETLEKMVPGIRIGVAHGQMDEDGLERAMVNFVNGDTDLLLCTTIIESGLDIPSVNTLIVNNAHRFGLAQLYQIRGRIGRSNRQAFAYFVVPPVSSLTGDARSRLAALTKFSSVGSGFQIASIDMELRGVGDLLGANQSGHISAVGFDMYMHLLQESVSSLKDKEPSHRKVECQLEIPVQVYIPEDYIGSEHQRLVFYRMIATAPSPEKVEAYQAELQDRFGPIPQPVLGLLRIARIRLSAQALGISRMEVTASATQLRLEGCLDPVLQGVLMLIRQQPHPMKVTPDGRLVVSHPRAEGISPLDRAEQILSLVESSIPPQA